jgi:hypothetical protein
MWARPGPVSPRAADPWALAATSIIRGRRPSSGRADVRTTTERLLGHARSCDVCAGLARSSVRVLAGRRRWHWLRNVTASRTPYACTLSVRARPATCRPEAPTPVGTRWSTIVFEEGRSPRGASRLRRTPGGRFLVPSPNNPYRSAQQKLALQVESCSPRLLRLARPSASGDCGLSAGVLAAGPVKTTLAHLERGRGLPPRRIRRCRGIAARLRSRVGSSC